jgi:hypothetical protein
MSAAAGDWSDITFCTPFCVAFAKKDNGRYTLTHEAGHTAEDSLTAHSVAALKRIHSNAYTRKWAGKNGIKDSGDQSQLGNCCDFAVLRVSGMAAARSKVTHDMFVSEGDPVEESSVFVSGMIKDLSRAVDEMSRPRAKNRRDVCLLIVRGVQDDYSPLFVEGWKAIIEGMGLQDKAHFAVIGATKEEEKKKASFTYALADAVINIGSSYKQYAFQKDSDGSPKLDADGKPIKTQGFKELEALLELETMQENCMADAPKGVRIVERVASAM